MALDNSWAKKNGQYACVQTPAIRSSKAKDLNLAHQLYDQTLGLVKNYL